MAENENKAEDETEIPTVALPPRPAFPPPPEVNYQRPTLGNAAPHTKPVSRQSVSDTQGDSADNAARMGAGMSAGILLAASIVVGFLIGQWIDKHWNHSAIPWGTLVMSLAGIAAGFINLFRILNVSDRNRK